MRQGEVYKMLGIDDFDIIDDGFWKQCFKVDKEVHSYKDAFEWFYMQDGNWGYRDIMYYAAAVFLDESSELYNKTKGLKWLQRSAKLKYDDAINLLKKYEEWKQNGWTKQEANENGFVFSRSQQAQQYLELLNRLTERQ
jgi:hypothetical protein